MPHAPGVRGAPGSTPGTLLAPPRVVLSAGHWGTGRLGGSCGARGCSRSWLHPTVSGGWSRQWPPGTGLARVGPGRAGSSPSGDEGAPGGFGVSQQGRGGRQGHLTAPRPLVADAPGWAGGVRLPCPGFGCPPAGGSWPEVGGSWASPHRGARTSRGFSWEGPRPAERYPTHRGSLHGAEKPHGGSWPTGGSRPHGEAHGALPAADGAALPSPPPPAQTRRARAPPAGRAAGGSPAPWRQGGADWLPS